MSGQPERASRNGASSAVQELDVTPVVRVEMVNYQDWAIWRFGAHRIAQVRPIAVPSD